MPKTTTASTNVLTFSDAVAAIGGKGPSSKGWYNGHCPAHQDGAASLGILERPDGSFAIKCQASCKRADIIAALERKTGKQYPKGKGKAKERAALTGLTLEQYAALKHLPGMFLGMLYHTVTCDYFGKPAVQFPYCDESGALRGVKFRVGKSSHDGRWAEGYSGSFLFGLDVLTILQRENGWDMSRIVLAEGESDTQTCVFNGLPALGISGKSGWKKEFANLPILQAAKEIFVVRDEPDADEFVEDVMASFPGKAYKLILPGGDEGKSDPSALWIASKSGAEFDDAWQKAIEGAYDRSVAFTDTGNAERLVKKHGQNFRWVTDAETFRVWNGQVWHGDSKGAILLPHTKDVVRAIADPDWRASSESAQKRNAMIAMSKGEREVHAERHLFDTHPMLLNVKNGTVDLLAKLGSGKTLRDFCREDYLTKQATVDYDPWASCPKFDEFLRFIFDEDRDTIHFVLKALGYSLTGNIGEQCFFMSFGLGANGKSTLLEVLIKMLGADFATTAKFSTFVVTKAMDSKYELAQFQGKRLVTTVEPRKAGHLDEEVLKQMTGGDIVRARDIYQKDIVYYPEFKLWMAMNNQPRILGTDEGIWRRVRMIPFNVRIPEDRKIKDFSTMLMAEEGPGILNRLLEGVQAWREEGLKMSGTVERATTEFRISQNVIQRFFDTHTVVGQPNLHARAGALYTTYRTWAEREKEFAIRQNEFADELERRGFVRRRAHEGFEWWGIGLRA